MKRLFVGVPLPAAGQIRGLLRELQGMDADLKLVSVENLHFTVKFMGEVAEGKIGEIGDKILAATAGLTAFTAPLRGLGSFPPLPQPSLPSLSRLPQPSLPPLLPSLSLPSAGRINSIWLGAPSGDFVQLIDKVQAALFSFGPQVHQETVPHATLARVKSGRNKEKLVEFLEKCRDADFGKMLVESIVLYESELRPEGPVYRAMRVFKLHQKD